MITSFPRPARRRAALAALALGLLAGAPACTSSSNGMPLAHGGESLTAASGPWRTQLVDGHGYPLRTYAHGAETWVLGALGQRYGVRVDNPTAQRVEVVVTVDGRDTINGAPGSLSARGYIVEPYGHVVVDGFRTSSHGVAAFRFTTPGDSYAGRVGGGANIGVIGVAVFPERARQVVARPAPLSPWIEDGRRRGAAKAEQESVADSAGADAPRQPPGLGTQYGEHRHSPTVEVQFERASSEPAAVLAIYYDDHGGLARRGIVAPPYQVQPRDPAPFPGTSDRRFTPPPP